ncbi:hypothetical protein PFISCL1PPCAC_18149, partial [Pristionchus fissidentatus]
LPTVCVSAGDSPDAPPDAAGSTTTVTSAMSSFFTPGPDILSPTPIRFPHGAAFTKWRSERLSSGSDSAVQLSPPAPMMSHSLTNLIALSPLSPPGLSPLHFGDSAFSTPNTSKSTTTRFTFDQASIGIKRTASSAECSGLDRDATASAFRPPDRSMLLQQRQQQEGLMDMLKSFREASEKAAAAQHLQQQQRQHRPLQRSHAVMLERKQSLKPGAGTSQHASLRGSESMPVGGSSIFTRKPADLTS